MSPSSWRAAIGSLVLVICLVSRWGEFSPARLADCRFAWTLGESQRVDRALDSVAMRQGLPEGHLPRLWAAVRDHVPDQAWVAMVSKDVKNRFLTHIVLCAVAFPRRFVLLDSLEAGWQQKLGSLSPNGHVLEYSTPADPQVPASCDLLARGDFYAIWRLRGEGR